MPTALRSTFTAGVALMSAGVMAAAPASARLTPPLREAQIRVVDSAVTLAAAVSNSQACSGYHTDGCNIMARPVYQPVAIDPAGTAANIPLNLLNGVVGIPRAFVDAINEISYAMEVTGNWWVYSPTNVLGFDPADPPKITALADLFIPFKPLSHAVGEHLAWWARANLPMNAGCTGSARPVCPDLGAILNVMFKAPIWTLAGGYQFPKLFNPVSEAEGDLGDEIPGSVGTEMPWSEEYVKLSSSDWINSVVNYLQADPAANTPKPITGSELSATFERLGKGLMLDFNPFVPRSFLLKGRPFTVLSPLFLPAVPILCKTCNPDNPGGPPLNPTAGAAAATAPVEAATTNVPAESLAGSVVAATALGAATPNKARAERSGERSQKSAPADLSSPESAPAAGSTPAADSTPAATGTGSAESAPATASRRGHRGGSRKAGTQAEHPGRTARAHATAAG